MEKLQLSLLGHKCYGANPDARAPSEEIWTLQGWYSQWKLRLTRMICASRSIRERRPRLRAAQHQGRRTRC